MTGKATGTAGHELRLRRSHLIISCISNKLCTEKAIDDEPRGVTDLDLRDIIRVVEDFPEPGVSFKDITTVLRDADAFHYAVERLVEYGRSRDADVVVGPEARGFVFGAPVAYALGVGFVPIRKPGKLPARTIGRSYELEYGKDGLEMHEDALSHGDRVLVVDDLLATGGTIKTCATLVEERGGVVAGMAFLIELGKLGGRGRLAGYDVWSLVQYD